MYGKSDFRLAKLRNPVIIECIDIDEIPQRG